MSKLLEKKLSDLEERLRFGHRHYVAKELLKIRKQRKVPISNILHFSNLARRCGLPDESLKVLFPYFKADKGINQEPGPKELMEYASSLNVVGAGNEALNHIGKIDLKKFPEANFTYGSILFKRWDYKLSIPYWQRYCEIGSLSNYQLLVGKFNLSTAYFHSKMINEAMPLIDEVISGAQKENFKALEAACWQLLGQAFIISKQWNEAQNCFKKYDKIYPGQTNIILDKWKILAEFYADPNKIKTDGAILLKFQKEAFDKRDFETVRNMDHHMAILKRDLSLLLRVYYGTPYQTLKENILKDWGEEVAVPETFDWGDTSIKGIDLRTGKCIGHEGFIKANGNSYETLKALSMDFYSPSSFAHLHELIFPGDYYNPHSSPRRVRMAMNRLAKEFENKGIPLAVSRRNGLYALEFKDHFFIRIQKSQSKGIDSDYEPAYFQMLKQQLNDLHCFSSKEAAQVFNTSTRSATNFLKVLLDEGWISKSGAGKATRYSIPADKLAS